MCRSTRLEHPRDRTDPDTEKITKYKRQFPIPGIISCRTKVINIECEIFEILKLSKEMAPMPGIALWAGDQMDTF